MRTLLVDNYDSFTHNLAHYLAEVNGASPVIIRNDDPRFGIDDLDGFDNVVISPGPGTPEREADFGICREIIEKAVLPVLGICLGHQGIAHAYGASVGRAPEPRHGRLSPVRHTGTGLFAGLPSPFRAVRYHSLAVTRLPDELEATAWTPDGLLMAFRHRDRPQWGVQFHPESICTEHGHQLLENFAELTRRHHDPSRTAQPRTAQSRTAQPRTTRSRTVPASGAVRPRRPVRRLRVLTESLPTRWHDEVVFQRLFGSEKHAFWLDSSRADGDLGRFSVMGDASGPLARVARADTWRQVVQVTSGGTTDIVRGGFLDWLDQDLAGLEVDTPDLPCDFVLGWVGYLGYELKAECGGARTHRSPDPDAAMVFADRAIVFDHATATTHLLALAEDDERPARDWLDATARTLTRELADRVPRPPAESRRPAPITLRHDRDRYLELIGECQEFIAAGESYEICLTNMAEGRAPLDPWESYRSLRRSSPAPFGALLRFGALSVLSTSPERFLRIEADGTVESKPIKGTRRRGASAEEDAALREDLRASEKDRAENLMIVDLVRNDLAVCAEPGSVHVPRLFDVESYATVHQLVSTVRGTLRAECSAVDAVRAAFPGGSMTGAPKIRTMEIIDRLEGAARGVYSGAIGYLSLTGASDLSIVIRTLVASGSQVRYGVGGAIIALSDAEEEFEETAVKAAPLLRLLDSGFPGRAPMEHTA
ncbi:aminodeoxychorismate synthase component I [Streptomyces sp. W16]|uniref:aminodeoxychorismate synthase component I n=1 Tax=Streptomyces sp. W16 TaxID=3076631 RepID=UPI00295AA11D|nr:aminodeoxychorismate synthase component I [Streptomyces sp. W16]MDV9169068.1 aminodeoxychorismate synthase component I [Streptomyces sp. W16]